MKTKSIFLFLFLIVLLPLRAFAGKQLVISTEKGKVNINILADNAVRVRYGGEQTLPELFYLGDDSGKVKYKQKETDSQIVITTEKMMIVVDKASGTPKFFSINGKERKLVLTELSHSLTASKLHDDTTHIARLTLDSPEDECLYGLGQFQDGYLNVRGLSRRLTQVNTQISMPMVLSNRGYALLWNNYGLTEFNQGTNAVALSHIGEGQETEVNVTSTEGGKVERRREGSFLAEIDIAEDGDYSLLLDVGRTMARKHNLNIDGSPVINLENRWLPPTTSVICHLKPGKHTVTANLANDDKPVLYYSKVENTTRFMSPVAEAVDYTVFVGCADEAIATYRSLTGHSPMQPLWAFGYVHCRERFHSTGEILSAANTFRRKQLPMDVMVQDWQWWGQYGWNAFKFDEHHYPDPKLLVDSLHALGARLMLSVWSKIDENSEVGKEAKAKSYYIPGTTWIDFFNKDAADFYWHNFTSRLLQPYKIDCWWQDATEPENDDLRGRRINSGKEYGEVYRNVYPNFVSKVVYEGCKRDMPDHRTFILTRSGAPGIHRYGSFLWSGDVGNDWQTLRYQLTGGLNLMAAGHPWWTYDAGGFFRPGRGQYTDKAYHECFLRWLQIATFLPMMRVHGYQTDTEFWRFGDDVEREAKRQLELRYRLIPYVYSACYQVTKGSTMMRPLVMDFANDRQALAAEDQYMFGKSILVVPVLAPSVSARKVYLPESKGGWYDLHTGKHYAQSKTMVTVPVTISNIPVFVKAGSIVPNAQPMQTTANYDADSLIINIYPGDDAEFTLYEDEGTNNNYEQGQFSTIKFAWNDKSRTLTIGKRNGSFSGMLNSRKFIVRVIGETEKCVEYNGKLMNIIR